MDRDAEHDKAASSHYPVTMTGTPFAVIDKFKDHENVSVHESDDAKILQLKAGNLTITVTVLRDALEWWVDVARNDEVVVIDSWDYEDGDDTPREELAQSMAWDINVFVKNLLTRELRLVPAARTGLAGIIWKLMQRDIRRPDRRQVLEWKMGETWKPAVPFR